MKIARNIKAISRLLLILFLLLATIIGAIFSYLLVVGYYINLEIRVPENTTLSVMDVTFDPRDAETFNITILNPSYSPTEANITEISVVTQDNTFHQILDVNPPLPIELDKGQDETFNCAWRWGDYAGENVKVIVLVEEGSGSAYETETTPLELTITTMSFDPTDTKHFNMTLRNSIQSLASINLTEIRVTMDNGTFFEVSETAPTLPQMLGQDTFNTFAVSWDWSDYRGRNVTVTAFTSEDYTAYRTQSTPQPVLLSVTDINTDPSNTTYFNVTVTNTENSITSAILSRIKLNLENETVEITASSPSLPYTLPIGETVTFTCLWDWTDRQQETLIIVVETTEGYLGVSEIYAIG